MLPPSSPGLSRPVALLALGAALSWAAPAVAQAPATSNPTRDRRANADESLRRADAQRDFASAQAGDELPDVDELGRVRGQSVIELERDLYVLNDVMLQGITAHETMTFSVPESWNLTSDPVINLNFEHSSPLSPFRSTLTMRVNGSAVGSVQLTADNVTEGAMQARIPRHLLKDFNELKLSVVQHIDDECEDPFDPALWTRVNRTSSLTFDYYEDPVRGELGDLPEPLFDPLGYGPVHVALAGSAGYSAAQLEALGEVSFALGRVAAYRGVVFDDPVTNLRAADSHVLVLGTPAENPLVAQLVPSQLPGAGEGLIAVVPRPGDPTKAALVVTGGDAAGLLKAAEALSSNDRAEILSGRASIVESVNDGDPPATRQLPLPIPAEEEFTLVDLGIGDTTVRGYYAPPIQIPLRMEGDAQVQVDGAQVGIDYAYSAYLDTRLSTMEVRLNGVTLRSIGLEELEGEERDRLWVDLPFDLMEPESELEVVFHLFPRDFGPCVYITDTHIWGTVFSSSRMEVYRDRYTDLPDLGLLKYDLWPYNEALADEGVIVVTDNDPSAWDATAAAQMASELGKRAIAKSPSLRVVPASGGLSQRAGNSQIVAVVGDGPHAVFDELRSQGKARLPGEVNRELNGDGDDKMSATVGAGYGTIEQALLTPTGRTALVLRSSADTTLPDLVRLLSDESRLRQLGDTLAVVGADSRDREGSVRLLEASDQARVGTIPLRSQLQKLMRRGYWALVLAVVLAGFLLALLVREWADRRGGQA